MADKNILALTELTTTASTDMLYIVDDPSGTPLDKKITVGNLLSGLVISNDATITTLLGTFGDYIRIGDANTTSHSLNSNDDLVVTGELEINGAMFVDNVSTFGGGATFGAAVSAGDNIDFRLGSGSDAGFFFSTAQTNDSMIYTVDNVSRTMILCEKADQGTNFGHAAQINPTLFVQSADGTDVSDWISLSHDQASGILEVGGGSLVLRAAGNVVTLEDDMQLSFGTANDSRIVHSTAQTNDSLLFAVGAETNAVSLIQTGDVAFDFSHGLQTNPTWFIHSANQSTTEWVGITHNQTDAVITAGAGVVQLPDASKMATSAAPTADAELANKKYVDDNGGGLSGTSVVTIGTGGTYSDVAAAIAGESTPYNFVLVSDVAEDSDITIDGVFILDLDVFTLTLAANQFLFSGGTAADVIIFGKGMDSGAEIDYTQTTTNKSVFEAEPTNSTFVFSGFLFDNNSTVDDCGMLHNRLAYFDNVRFELPDKNDCGTRLVEAGSRITNCHFVGGGTSCDSGLNASGNVTISNIFVTGTWSTTVAAVTSSNPQSTISGIVFLVSTSKCVINIGGNASNIVTETSGGQDLDMTVGANAKLSGIDLGGGTLDLTTRDNVKITNLVTTGSIDMTDATSTNCVLVNCRVTGALSVGGDRHKFTNCDFLGGGAAVSGALHNIFAGCQFGPDGGGGALTMTFDAGANTNILTGCISDAAVVDNGTSNTTANNIVF